jgi:5-methyltetrahydrofolate--homocysteine methyltransferase
MTQPNAIADELKAAVASGRASDIAHLTRQALEAGMEPLSIADILSEGIRGLGDRFSRGEVFLPELMMGSKAMKEGIAILIPELKKSEESIAKSGRLVIGSVAGDIHDIGKNLVTLMMEISGFEAIDLGVDVSIDRFLEAVKEHNPDILGLSALLTPTMVQQQEVMLALTKDGLRDRVKVMVGGAPATQDWARRIGADGYAPDAVSCVRVASELLGL